mgnify:FL=1
MNNLSRTLVLCSTLMLTACAEDDPQKFIEEGKALFEKGEFKSARVQFKNALQINPQLPEVYYAIALLEEKKENWPAMKRNLEDTVRLDPNHVEAQVKLGFLLGAQIEEAKEHNKIALEQDSENINAILLDATIKLKEGDKSGALQQVERVLVKNADNIDALRLKVTILASDKKFDEALLVLNHGISVYSKDSSLGLLKVRLHKDQGQVDEVIRDYETLIALHPSDKALRQDQIQTMMKIGRPELAEQAMQDAIASDPADIDLKLRLINFIEVRNVEKTEDLLKKFVAENQNETRLKSRLAGFYIGRMRYPEAKIILQQLVDSDPTGNNGLIAKVRLAEIVWAQKDKEAAEVLVQEVISVDSGNSGALLLRATMRISGKDGDGAISDLRVVLRDKPNSDVAMVMLARAYMLNGEPEVAESHLRKALEVNPANLAAIAPLTLDLLKRGDSLRAEALLSKSIKASPNNPALLELFVKVKVAQKDWVGVSVAINELKKLPQGIVAAQMLEGMMYTRKGEYQEAVKIYKDVLSKKPNETKALVAMARSFNAIGRRDNFFAYLLGFIKENPSNINAYNTLGRAYAEDEKWDDAGDILKKSLEIEPKALGTYSLLAGVLVKQGRSNEVAELYRKGLVENPSNFQLMMALAKQLQGMKKFSDAITIYDKLIEIVPNNLEVVNNLADSILSSNPSSADLERTKLLVEGFKNTKNPYFLDTYGWVLFKAGEFDKAVATLKQSAKVVPDNAIIRYHLGEAYYAKGEYGASKIELEKSLALIEKNGKFSGFERAQQLLKEVSETAPG